MKNFLKEHTKLINNILEGDSGNWKEIGDFHRAQINFLQHERLIHLLVTFFFGFIFLIFIAAYLACFNLGFLLLAAMLVILLGFYIWHYFVLENGIQKLYELDKKISEKYLKDICKR